MTVAGVASFILALLGFFGVDGGRIPTRWRYAASASLVAVTATLIVWPSAVWRIGIWRTRRQQRAALRRHWPKFLWFTKEAALLFKQGESRSIYRVLEAVDAGERRELELSLVVFKDLAEDLPKLVSVIIPTHTEQARPLVKHFERLLYNLERAGVLEKVREAELPTNWVKLRDTFFGDYEDLKRSYRKFAQEANDSVGEFVFGGMLPG